MSKLMAGGEAVPADLNAGQVPEFYSVHAQRADGSFEHLQTVPTRDAAEDLSHWLRLVDAHAEINELDQAAKLARLKDRRSTPQSDVDGRAARCSEGGPSANQRGSGRGRPRPERPTRAAWL